LRDEIYERSNIEWDKILQKGKLGYFYLFPCWLVAECQKNTFQKYISVSFSCYIYYKYSVNDWLVIGVLFFSFHVKVGKIMNRLRKQGI
jgi:hypothetical protein